jgi:hypothetical protein
MKQIHGKLFLGLVMVMAIALIFSTKATAIIIDDYNPKLNGVQGVITKIEGSKITLRDEAGKLHTIGVRSESNDDKHKLRGFKLGDKVKIEGGRLILPQR